MTAGFWGAAYYQGFFWMRMFQWTMAVSSGMVNRLNIKIRREFWKNKSEKIVVNTVAGEFGPIYCQKDIFPVWLREGF